MALEDDVKALTLALTNLTEKLPVNGAAAAPATTTAPATRGPGRPRKVSLDEVKAVAAKLVTERSRPVAVKLIHDLGGAQLADLDESKYAEFIAAAELLIKQQPAEASESEL